MRTWSTCTKDYMQDVSWTISEAGLARAASIPPQYTLCIDHQLCIPDVAEATICSGAVYYRGALHPLPIGTPEGITAKLAPLGDIGG